MKEIIAYIDHKKNVWIVWTADFSGDVPDMPMREYPLTMTKQEAIASFKNEFGF